MDCSSLPEACQFTSDLRSSSSQFPDPRYFSAVRCYLLLGNSNYEILTVLVDWYFKSNLMEHFGFFQKLWQKITRNHWFGIYEKKNNTWHFNIKHNKNKFIIIFQWTIAHNVPFVDPSHKNKNWININHSPSLFWL